MLQNIVNGFDLEFTKHARRRTKERCINPSAIDIIIRDGISTRSRGGDSYFFNKSSRHRLRQKLGKSEYQAIERWLNVYVVVGDNGQVITAAWRTQRLYRN